MSEIRANTISNAAGTGPATLTGQSAAKAWCANSQTAIADSFNCTSITDNAAGTLTVSYTNAFGSANYGLGAAAQYRRSIYQNSQAAGSIQFYFTDPNASETAGVDIGNANGCVWAAHGDLA